MNGLKSVVAVSSLLAGTQACTVQNYSHPTNAATPTVTAPVYMDLDVGQPIEGKASCSVLFGFLTIGSPGKLADGVAYGSGESSGVFGFVGGGAESDAKSGAAYEAIHGANADYIVNPRYELETTSYIIFKTIKAKVKGNSGKIKKISSIPQDVYFRGTAK